MPAQQGQTDQVLKIKLTSYLLHARWLDDVVAGNGSVGLEVSTAYVGDGAPIKITFKDLEGKTLGTQEGRVLSNFFRTIYINKGPNSTGGITFEAEMPKHGLKKISGKVRVAKPIEFSGLRFTDPEGKKLLTEILEDRPAACEAKVKGIELDRKVVISVYFRTNFVTAEGTLLTEAEVPVKDGKAVLLFNPIIKDRIDRVKIQHDLDKEGGSYLQPELYFKVSALGVKAESDPGKVVQTLILHFWETPGNAGSWEGKHVTLIGPDGVKEEKTIPKDGQVVVRKSKPGKYKGEGDAIKNLKPAEDSSPSQETSEAKKLDQTAKEKLVAITARIESGGGSSGYYAMNLDYEFEGRFDYPTRWWKSNVDKPESQGKSIKQSKYFNTPQHVGLSYGLIQFTQQYLLGPLLKKMELADKAKFEEVFGVHSQELLKVTNSTGASQLLDEEVFDNHGNSMGTKKVKRKTTVMPVGGEDLWKPYWTSRFKKAGQHPAFKKCQDNMATEKFLDPIIKYAKSVGIKELSEKSLCLLFDRKVQEGNVKAYVDALSKGKDESKYWESISSMKEKSIKERMEGLIKNEQISYSSHYEL